MRAQDRYGYAHLPASALLVGTERDRGKVRGQGIISPFLSRSVGEEGGWGEGESRQACSAAPTM
jgi:hypothetical protein